MRILHFERIAVLENGLFSPRFYKADKLVNDPDTKYGRIV